MDKNELITALQEMPDFDVFILDGHGPCNIKKVVVDNVNDEIYIVMGD